MLECNINAEVVIDIILDVSAKNFYFEFFPNLSPVYYSVTQFVIGSTKFVYHSITQ